MYVFTFAVALGCASAAGAAERATLSEALRGRTVAHAAKRVRTKSSQHADSSLMQTSTFMHKATRREALMTELPSENLGKVVDSISELNKIQGDWKRMYEEAKKNNTGLKKEVANFHSLLKNIINSSEYLADYCNESVPAPTDATNTTEVEMITSGNLCFEWEICNSIDKGDLAVSVLI